MGQNSAFNITFIGYIKNAMVPHRYDYEPVFICLKKEGSPHLIVNGGLGSMESSFHKNEIRPQVFVSTSYLAMQSTTVYL